MLQQLKKALKTILQKQQTRKKISLVLILCLCAGLIQGLFPLHVSADGGDPDPGDDSGTYLFIGGVPVVSGGAWIEGTQTDVVLNGVHYDYLYETDDYRMMKGFQNDFEDYPAYFANEYVLELKTGADCGGIELNSMILYIIGADETDTSYRIGTIAASGLDDVARTMLDLPSVSEQDPAGYSVYCHRGRIVITPYRAYRYRYDFAGGIRLGDDNGFGFGGCDAVIGTPDHPAPVGIENIRNSSADCPFGCNSAQVTIYADILFKDVDRIIMEADSSLTAVSTDTGVAGVIQRSDSAATPFEVKYGSGLAFHYAASLGSIEAVCTYLDPSRPGYDINQQTDSEAANTTKEQVTGFSDATNFNNTTEHYRIQKDESGTDHVFRFESLDPPLSTIGWKVRDLEAGGGFEILSGKGYLMNVNEAGDDTDYSYCLEQGSTLEIKVEPKYGYQFDVTQFRDHDSTLPEEENEPVELFPQTETAVYTLQIPARNIHLADVYTEVPNDLNAEESDRICGGEFSLSDEEDTSDIHGTLEMVVSDSAASSDAYMSELESGYTLGAFVDVSVHPEITQNRGLENVEKLAWVGENITSFANDITIAMEITGELADSLTVDSMVSVVRDHEGTKTVLEGTVVSHEDKLYVVFATRQFSTFAIAYKEGEQITYTINDTAGSGTYVSFNALAGKNYEFEFVDITNPSAEMLAEMEIPAEMWDELMSSVKNKLASAGTLLKIYDINLYDADNGSKRENGPFTVKIPLNSELKALLAPYDSFAFTNIDTDENGMVYGATASASIDGDFLVTELPHFSGWVLTGKLTQHPDSQNENVGSEDNNSDNNPDKSDSGTDSNASESSSPDSNGSNSSSTDNSDSNSSSTDNSDSISSGTGQTDTEDNNEKTEVVITSDGSRREITETSDGNLSLKETLSDNSGTVYATQHADGNIDFLIAHTTEGLGTSLTIPHWVDIRNADGTTSDIALENLHVIIKPSVPSAAEQKLISDLSGKAANNIKLIDTQLYFLDISLRDLSNNAITELTGGITFKVTLPPDSGINFDLPVSVVRIHNGVAEILTAEKAAGELRTYRFTTDKFSTYVFVNTNAISPRTGEAGTAFSVWGSLLVFVFLALLFLARRKRNA